MVQQPSSLPPSPPPVRGVTLSLELPDVPADTLLELAGVLHALAQDLAPGAPARTDVHLAPPGPTADPRYLTDPRPPRPGHDPRENHVHHR